MTFWLFSFLLLIQILLLAAVWMARWCFYFYLFVVCTLWSYFYHVASLCLMSCICLILPNLCCFLLRLFYGTCLLTSHIYKGYSLVVERGPSTLRLLYVPVSVSHDVSCSGFCVSQSSTCALSYPRSLANDDVTVVYSNKSVILDILGQALLMICWLDISLYAHSVFH